MILQNTSKSKNRPNNNSKAPQHRAVLWMLEITSAGSGLLISRKGVYSSYRPSSWIFGPSISSRPIQENQCHICRSPLFFLTSEHAVFDRIQDMRSLSCRRVQGFDSPTPLGSGRLRKRRVVAIAAEPHSLEAGGTTF